MEEYLKRQKEKWKKEASKKEENDDSNEEMVSDLSDLPKPDILEEEEEEECEGEEEDVEDEKFSFNDWKEKQQQKWRIQEEEEERRRLELEKEREQKEREDQVLKDEILAQKMLEEMKKEEEEREKREMQEIDDFEMAMKLQKEYINESEEEPRIENNEREQNVDDVSDPHARKKKEEEEEEEEEEETDRSEDYPQVVDQLIGGEAEAPYIPSVTPGSIFQGTLPGRSRRRMFETESERQEREDREMAARLQRQFMNEGRNGQQRRTDPRSRDSSVFTFTTPSGSTGRIMSSGFGSEDDPFDDMFRSMMGRMRVPMMMRNSFGDGGNRRRSGDDFFSNFF